MKKYNIEIKEYLVKVITINADSPEKAVLKIKQMYEEEQIILDANDYFTTEINELKE